MEPTILCNYNYQIQIIFRLLNFIIAPQWESTLTSFCDQAFKFTILQLLDRISWNEKWCVDIEATYTNASSININRRLLQTENDMMDIDVDLIFDINDNLYMDYYGDYYNSSQFFDVFQEILNGLLQREFDNENNTNFTVEIEDLIIEEPINIDTDIVIISSTEILDEEYVSPYSAAIGIILGIFLIIFIGLCCCWLVTSFMSYHRNGGNETNKKEENLKSMWIEAPPNSPSNTLSTYPLSPSEVQMMEQRTSQMKDTLGAALKHLTGEQGDGAPTMERMTTFQKNLTNNVAVSDIMMNDIVNDMASGNEDNDEGDYDEDEFEDGSSHESDLDLDMSGYVETPM